MISNCRIICHWQDDIYEGVFMPTVPSQNDTVITPRGKGVVKDRTINCVDMKIIVKLEIVSLYEKS